MQRNSESVLNTERRAAVLIPAYEPDEKLVQTVADCMAAGLAPIVVVNDGSANACGAFFRSIAQQGVTVLTHPENRGKGAAIKTGISYISETFPDCVGVVTADADGQHAAEDIRAVAEALQKTAHGVVMGTRDFSGENIPWTSRAGNRITSVVFRLITGLNCRDTQTGLRGIPSALYERALSAQGERYDYEMNFLLDAAEHACPIIPVPIRTIYLDDNRSSHFRVVRDSYLIYRRPVTLAAGALAAEAVDLAGFWWLLQGVFGGGPAGIFPAAVLARLVSGGAKKLLQRPCVSRSGPTPLRAGLFLACMLLSGGGVTLLARAGAPVIPAKLLTDAALGLLRRLALRHWNRLHP